MMSENTSALFMIGLDIVMVTYTLWVVSLRNSTPGALFGMGAGLLAWLALVHLVLANRVVFPGDIAGPAFLVSIFGFVALVGLLLFLVPFVRRALLNLAQEQLLLLQGIRVFFGAGFLLQASLGGLPAGFAILDGWTHIAAGFLGLVASFCLASNNSGVRRAWFANIFGLVDILVVASTLSFVLLPDIGPYHSMMYAVFLPAPLWFWFHLISIWKLIGNHDKPVREPLAVTR